MKTENSISLTKCSSLKGEFNPPPDKSISHRSIIFASISEGRSVIENFLDAEDPISTLNAFKSMGVEINKSGNTIDVKGKGLLGLREPENIIDCGNSGTTMRLLCGLLSACPFFSILTGDESLVHRPVLRVTSPLREMGAAITARDNGRFPPVALKGGDLKAISYKMPVASAQVKSSIILGGLFADGVTVIEEPVKSRDHTERMLPSFGANIEVKGLSVTVTKGSRLYGSKVLIPGDFSSAAFFIAAAMMVKGSEVIIKDVGLNPTRTGFLNVVKKMNGNVEVVNSRSVSGEIIGDIICKFTPELQSVTLGKDDIPAMIDEFPVLCILASQAEGVTEIRGAEELRIKESDRISAMARGLTQMGAHVDEYDDGMAVKGPVKLTGAVTESRKDHRVAMAFSVASMIADGPTTIVDSSCIGISFPGFFDILKRLSKP